MGFLAKLQDTLFVNRAPTLSAIKQSRARIQQLLDQKQRLILFPEGTNTIGDKVLPFRRGMLDNLSAPGYKLQPVAIKALAIEGRPVVTRTDYEVYGWGDMSFVLHLWRFMAYKNVDVDVMFLTPYAVNAEGKIEGISIEKAGDDVRQKVENAL